MTTRSDGPIVLNMILRHHRPSQPLQGLLHLLAPRGPCECTRGLHRLIRALPPPPPTPFVPDVQTFLKVIGRKSSQHAAKFPSWEALFSVTSAQLRALGLEPARARRYLLRWRDKFRNGQFGVGGDLTDVVDGAGEVRIVTIPVPARPSASDEEEDRAKHRPTGTATLSPGTRKIIVSVKPGAKEPSLPLEQAKPVNQLKIRDGHLIVGPYTYAVKGTQGSVAHIKVTEGMWEDKRGRKIDGGERRRAEVRAKRRSRENAQS